MALRSRVRFKATDIWDAPDDGYRYEVIDGELFLSPAPDWGHQRSIGELHAYLWQHIRPLGLGEVVESPVGVVLDEETAVQPDLVYIARERLHIISERGVDGAPDLVVEALSPSTRARDLGVKMRRYAGAGIPHYWTLDHHDRTLCAYRLGAGEYDLVATCGPGSVFEPELFPGLRIPVDDLWR